MNRGRRLVKPRSLPAGGCGGFTRRGGATNEWNVKCWYTCPFFVSFVRPPSLVFIALRRVGDFVVGGVLGNTEEFW